MEAADTIRGFLAIAVGLLMGATAFALAAYKPVRAIIRQVDSHAIETVDKRIEAVVEPLVNKMAANVDRQAVLYDALAKNVDKLTARMDAHLDSGRHGS